MSRRQKAPHDGLDGSSPSSHRRSQTQMRQQETLPIHHSTSPRLTNPNIFSDDYALENEISSPGTPVEVHNTGRSFRPLSIASNASSFHFMSSYPDLPAPTASSSSTNYEPATNPFDDNARSSFERLPRDPDIGKSSGLPQRNPSISTISTQSQVPHTSTSRSVSPYTGPSHPYGMYPQVGLSRSASVVSTATARPSGPPLQDPTVPQHPYGMYQQNTVMDEGGEAAGITLGFPNNLGGYSASYPPPMARPDEVGDIVGPDGHLEQLPPYSRYPDGIPPKRGMGAASIASIAREQPALAVSEPDVESSDALSTRTLVNSSSDVERPRSEVRPSAPAPPLPSTQEEKSERRGPNRMCCGMPLWFIWVVGAGVLVGGFIGGVIGGVLGERRARAHFAAVAAASSASASTPASPTPSVVTVTYTSDVTPLPTLPSNLPPLPTGRYQVPVNINNMSRFCVSQYPQSWRCMNSGQMEIVVDGYDTNSPTVELPNPVFNTSNLNYGPQPPFLTSPTQSLHPIMDKLDPTYGPALFFASAFDKLVIVPGDYFNPSKRSMIGSNQNHRGRWDQVSLTDSPWFCWWNVTAMEFFIFVEDPGPSVTSIVTATDNGGTHISTETQSANMGMVTGANPNDPSNPAPVFPRRVKVEEKRIIPGAPQPSCVRMTPSGTGFAPSTTTFLIDEKPLPTQHSKRSSWNEPRQDNGAPPSGQGGSSADGYSNICYCEWLSD